MRNSRVTMWISNLATVKCLVIEEHSNRYLTKFGKDLIVLPRII